MELEVASLSGRAQELKRYMPDLRLYHNPNFLLECTDVLGTTISSFACLTFHDGDGLEMLCVAHF